MWLLNQTTTKAVEGMTPFKATFGKKPDLRKVCGWGEKVFVRIEGGTKLGGRVCEGHWLGIDLKLKGTRVYWLDSKTVTVEQNIYYNNLPVSLLEEEQEPLGLTKTIAKENAKIPPDPPIVQTQETVDNSGQDSDASTPAK